MSQIIVAIACLIGLIALGLVFVRFYRENEDTDEMKSSHAPPETHTSLVRTRPENTVRFTDRQIAQQGRKLAQEVEQFLADQSHCE